MGLFKLRTAIAGLTSLLAASALLADAVVDKALDNDQNEFEQYWYYYDDNAGIGGNDRPSAGPATRATVINVPFTEKARQFHGKTSDTWKVKTYTFKTDNSKAKPCATMPFTMGESWTASYGKAFPFCGLGTMLAPDSHAVDLSTATKVKFLIKSRVGELPVRFKVQTMDIDKYSDKDSADLQGDEFGYFGYNFTASPGDWQPVELNLAATPTGDFALPGTWAHKFTFDLSQATKLAWEITGDGIITSDTLDIAEVEIVGDYVFISPFTWTKVETAQIAKGWFHTFDVAPRNQTPLLTYWYAYDDGQINGNSVCDTNYAVKNAKGLLDIKFTTPNSGANGTGYGAALGYTLGKLIPQDTVSIQGFVGIGVNVYDSATNTYFNADSFGATGIYFEYTTEQSNDKKLTLEISDMNDVADDAHRTRKDSRGSGIVYFRNLPPTGPGEWKKVMVPFDSLKVQESWKGYNPIPFDKKHLAKLQWKIQSAEGTEGIFAIDNIGFYGAENWVPPPSSSVKNKLSKVQSSSFRVLCKNGAVRVNWNDKADFTNGKVNFININGAVVRSYSVANAKELSAITAEKLSAGMYLVKLNATDVNGKAMIRQSSINIVK